MPSSERPASGRNARDTKLKRTLDLIAAGLGLLVLSPLLGVLALAILLDDGAPVLFVQERVGRHGAHFRILKLRTMRVQPPGQGPLLTAASDARVTRVGRVLRRSKLDELPQLVNVLRGEMSLVGPRPEVARYVACYSETQRAVLALTPGITDPASLAFLDEERLLAAVAEPERFYVEHAMPAKIALNLDYARRATFWSDVRVILQTLFGLVAARREA
jgi:lipopolysaccharide/colanic/teichoic acid biosynthesis glycosyltransferase